MREHCFWRIGGADGPGTGARIGSRCFSREGALEHSFRSAADGRIYTATVFRLDEKLKGKFGETVRLVHRGGEVNGEGESDGLSPRWRVGEEFLVFAGERADGTVFALRGSSSAKRLRRAGSAATAPLVPADRTMLDRVRARATKAKPGADLSDQTASLAQNANVLPGDGAETNAAPGLIADANAIAMRFIQQDRNEAIPYIVDAQSLPAGITQAQALAAVANAFAAWANVTSLKFNFEGTADFGQAALNVPASDGKIRIQLHDNHNYINSPGVLGQGGPGWTTEGVATGGAGARVGANEFHRTVRGALVLEHSHPVLQNLSTFEEVLCHEIGHILSMAHSSENPAEPNATLREATMYYAVHNDGRGATLGSYDPPVIQQSFPLSNTPPYGYSRVMDVMTSPVVVNAAGINEVQLRGYDRQTATNALTYSIISQTGGNGSFSFSGNTARFTPSVYGNGPRADPAGSAYYERFILRFSDGVNLSPFLNVRVISFMADSTPTPTDGLPDAWMVQYFGDTNPAAGPNRSATADFDGDGRSNIEEFQTGTDPTNPGSAFKATPYNVATLQWTAKPYELYEVQASADLATWAPLLNAVLPTTAAASVALPVDNAARKFYRVERVP